MTKILHYDFNADILSDSGDPQINPVKDLIDFINGTDCDLRIGFCSGGGEEGLSRYLLDCLNHNYNRITLMPYNFIGSAAFEVAYLFRGTVDIQQGLMGMVHYGSSRPTINDAGQLVYDADIARAKDRKGIKTWSKKFAKKVLKKKDYKKFKKGEDVYINYERMKEIFHEERYNDHDELINLM